MGFGFAETMSGTWTPSAGGTPRHFSFTVKVSSGPLRQFSSDKVARMTGTVDAEGIASERPLEGTLLLKPLIGRVIRYEFEFTGDDGKGYRFAGQKDIRWLDPVRTWTELPGEITDRTGAVVGRAMTYFDRRDTLPFLLSFRPALG